MDGSEAPPVLVGGWLGVRAGIARLLTHVRYWITVAPIVRAELDRWEELARAIPDSELRASALEAQRAERSNVEAAAMFSTLAPRAHCEDAAQASIALEVIYDYLDVLTERPVPGPLRSGRQLHRALTDALAPAMQPNRSYYSDAPWHDDGGYLDELVGAVRQALGKLPAAAAITEVGQRAATRCGEAQVRIHAAQLIGSAQLQSWAKREARGTGLRWQELLAGASASGVTLHALIAAAADSNTTPADAITIDAIYLPVGTIAKLLDSLVDHEQDIRQTRAPGYVRYYEDPALLAHVLLKLARRASYAARQTPHAVNHLVTVVSVVAYYTATSASTSDVARHVIGELKA